jgi:beta-galactosidase
VIHDVKPALLLRSNFARNSPALRGRMKKRIARVVTILLLLFLATTVAPAQSGAKSTAARAFSWRGDQFLLNGKPFVIRSGEMHYPRIPRAYWRDRIRKAKAMGLNTLTTYVFWNLHEPRPGRFDFSGNLDIAEFVRIARQEGMLVIVRPGPYVCAEWDWGGFPAWLAGVPEMKVRTSDPRFLAAADRYFKRLGRELRSQQITHGGPIIMVQVENEYGAFGKDKVYLEAIRRMLHDAGFDVLYFTSDNPNAQYLANGTLPGVLSFINFDSDPEEAFATFNKFRQNVPRMVGEYWAGWFDNWGGKHAEVASERIVRHLDWLLARGISFNIYMFHGGTSFGPMSGANSSDKDPYVPYVTSYDYDAPLDEAGRPTEKYYALREIIRKHLPAGETPAELPAPSTTIELPEIELKESAPLLASLDKLSRAVRVPKPLRMEALGQSYGLILYRTRLPRDTQGALEIKGAHDYAVVFNGETRLGTLDRSRGQTSVNVTVKSSAPLDILVEQMGRINYGWRVIGESKGITGSVALAGAELKGWEIYPLPLDDLKGLSFNPAPQTKREARGARTMPEFYRGSFTVDEPGDTFLDMRGWGKGYVWVNGRNLGRFWRIGPQQSLFLPAPWLKRGRNEIVILDIDGGGAQSVRGLRNPVYESPPQTTAVR